MRCGLTGPGGGASGPARTASCSWLYRYGGRVPPRLHSSSQAGPGLAAPSIPRRKDRLGAPRSQPPRLLQPRPQLLSQVFGVPTQIESCCRLSKEGGAVNYSAETCLIQGLDLENYAPRRGSRGGCREHKGEMKEIRRDPGRIPGKLCPPSPPGGCAPPTLEAAGEEKLAD